MRHRKVGSLVAGIADLTISELASHAPEVFAAPWVIIAMLDSSPVRGFQELISQRCPGTRLVDEVLVVPGDEVLALVRAEGVFQNFDELYLCSAAPASFKITTHFTSERANFAKQVPQEFLNAFQSVGGMRYFADGCGLNFICENMDPVSAIERAEKLIDRGYSHLGSFTRPPTL